MCVDVLMLLKLINKKLSCRILATKNKMCLQRDKRESKFIFIVSQATFTTQAYTHTQKRHVERHTLSTHACYCSFPAFTHSTKASSSRVACYTKGGNTKIISILVGFIIKCLSTFVHFSIRTSPRYSTRFTNEKKKASFGGKASDIGL